MNRGSRDGTDPTNALYRPADYRLRIYILRLERYGQHRGPALAGLARRRTEPVYGDGDHYSRERLHPRQGRDAERRGQHDSPTRAFSRPIPLYKKTELKDDIVARSIICFSP